MGQKEQTNKNLWMIEDKDTGDCIQVQKCGVETEGSIFRLIFYFNETLTTETLVIESTYSLKDKDDLSWQTLQWGKRNSFHIEAEKILMGLGHGDADLGAERLDHLLRPILREDRERWLYEGYEKELQEIEDEEFEKNCHDRFRYMKNGRF